MCLVHGDSGWLHWSDSVFDGVLAVHTIYFWREPLRDLQEIRRVLRPSGRLVLCFRPRDPTVSARRFPASVYTFYEIQEVEKLLHRAGFASMEVDARRLGHRQLAWAVAQPEKPGGLAK